MADRFDHNRSLSPVSLAPDREYVVELRWTEVAKIEAHYFWVLRDAEAGADIAEVHGFPRHESGNRNDKLAPDGSPFTIKQYTDDKPYRPEQQHPTNLRLAGKGSEIQGRWNDALERLKICNERDMRYASGGRDLHGGVNSNTVARTFGREFGFSSATLDAVPSTKVRPGWHVDLNLAFRGAAPSRRWFDSATPRESKDFFSLDRKIRAEDVPHKQRRVAAIFKRLYPGQRRTAPLGFGEGV